MYIDEVNLLEDHLVDLLIDVAASGENLVEREGSFSKFLWSFVGGKPRKNRPKSLKDVPAKTAESDALSKALAKQGFKFVGSTICYAFMQASGMVDDHVAGCHCARE